MLLGIISGILGLLSDFKVCFFFFFTRMPLGSPINHHSTTKIMACYQLVNKVNENCRLLEHLEGPEKWQSSTSLYFVKVWSVTCPMHQAAIFENQPTAEVYEDTLSTLLTFYRCQKLCGLESHKENLVPVQLQLKR